MTATYDPEPSLFGPEEPICPYTGLRTFTEEEAIYFRGRETHVAKCLALLGEKRFVMITGASGDGKSSLVFAGLVPEVRSGFLRGRYSNWAVATFRPERSPLRNMAQALATTLRLEGSAAAVETELGQGFSSLVQLYQASSLCPPTELPADLTAAEQRQYKLQAANLLLIVDQFEEFFTNPENYTDNLPNTAAQTVVNLLLETTRLAQAENLPIYIVCTMRSDFVGQCAEFRGLIEQIGTSQYFVPRLLRHEFVEVIKEPALLSGNRISERLVQRLLYDIRYGQDQLPVLQHALRRIWLAADQGREEMDLIHYAMVGGFSDELPPTDQARFEQWRASLSPQQQEFLLAHPSLRNVLDAHANQLYYEANDLYNQSFQPVLPPGTAERVIEQTFRVLTRTNGQRVVRNRLTGAEITAIINDDMLPWPVVCRILRPFRQPGTTFLSPFLSEDEDDSAVLPPDAVLDITHESLIRNWDHLAQWATQEAEDVRIAQDFIQQANRWQTNSENAGFLLPIGPYTYFSEWNRHKRDNASWLAHYVDIGAESMHRQEQAAAQSTVLTRFLAASRHRLFVPLLVARYGLSRLAAAVLLPVLLVGLGWWAWSVRKQQADYVAYTIIKERTPYLQSPYMSVDDKARFLIDTDRLQGFTYQPWLSSRAATSYAFPQLLDALGHDSLALNIELAMYRWINNAHYDRAVQEHPWTRRLLFDLDRRLANAGSILLPPKGQVSLSAHQRDLAVYTARTVMAITYYLSYAALHQQQGAHSRVAPTADLQRLAAIKQKLLLRLRAYTQREITTTKGAAPNPVDFGFCLRVLLGQGNFTLTELRFLDGLHPLKPGSAARRQFLRFFPAELNLYVAAGQIGHSGGYQTAAIIFAAQRQPAQLAQCLDSLRHQATKLDDVDSGIAFIPYLVKYDLFTPENVHSLLRRCSLIGDFPFHELYAATVYSLLSVSPAPRVYMVSPYYRAPKMRAPDGLSLGSVNPDRLNIDRVSFSVPDSVRDKVWATLQQATPTIAAAEPLFMEKSAHSSSNIPRNEAFLEAFLAKNHGSYLAEIKHNAAAATESFTTFSQALTRLKTELKGQEMINAFQWDLGSTELIQITQASSVAQEPIRYLQQTTRPKTMMFEAYYTYAYNAFFAYELRHAATLPVPNAAAVRQLDSIAFVEAAFPDRYSGTRELSLRTEAFGRLRDNQPNLAWIRAIAQVPLPGDEARIQRNAFLYSVSAALQDESRLRHLSLEQNILPFVQQLAQQPSFAQVPLQVALSDLATALAQVGRVQDAFRLAAALPTPLPTITKIRAGEQLMLTNNQRAQAPLDSFLVAYQRTARQQPAEVAGSSIRLFYWSSSQHRHGQSFEQTADFLIREGSPAIRETGFFSIAIGRSLADNSYQALLDAPAYAPEEQRQRYFNSILAGLAHLKTTRPGDGWYAYDDLVLVYMVSDYDGPTD